MKLRWQLLLSFFAAVLAGAAYGHFVLAPRNRAPEHLRPPAASAAAAVAVPAESDAAATPADEGDEADGPAIEDDVANAEAADQGEAAATAAAPDAGSREAIADTMVPEETAQSVDSHHARLDLGAAGIGTLLVREGRMERDGDGRFSPFARNPVVTRLRGDGPIRVELLHLGFDRDGHATVAHIRTTDAEPIEGVASLKHRGGYVAVLPDEPLQADDEAIEQP